MKFQMRYRTSLESISERNTVLHGSSRARDLTRAEKKILRMRDLTRCATWPVHRKFPEIIRRHPQKLRIYLRKLINVFWVLCSTSLFLIPHSLSCARFLIVYIHFITRNPEQNTLPQECATWPVHLEFRKQGVCATWPAARLDPCNTVIMTRIVPIGYQSR